MSARLPMFPLGTVLVPHGLLPLHVFEPRYRVLMFDCLRGDREFGVVLIERGSEVGGDDQRFGVATVAGIEAARELPDGRWFLLAMGTRRVDVVEWLPEDPYPVALVEDRASLPWPGSGPGAGAFGDGERAGAVMTAAEAVVRRIVELATQVGEPVAQAQFDLSPDPAVAAWQLVAVAPLGSLDKQRLLAIDDHEERLRRLTEMAQEEQLLLAYRLDRG